MEELHLSKEDQLEYDRILNEWIEKIKEIPEYGQRHNNRAQGVYTLDGGNNGPFTELEKIYRPKLDEIKARGGKGKVKKFSELIEKQDEILKGWF